MYQTSVCMQGMYFGYHLVSFHLFVDTYENGRVTKLTITYVDITL